MRLARPSSVRTGELARQIAVEQLLDLRLDVVGKLVAVGAEQLDAIVLERIVRGGDHHADVGAHRARQHGDGRRRHGAEQQRIHADGGEARHQRIFDHIAGEPRILADDDAMAALAAIVEDEAGGLTDLHRQLGRDLDIGEAADAVGSEIAAGHMQFPLRVANPFDCGKLRNLFAAILPYRVALCIRISRLVS